MRYIDVCSGISAPTMAWKPLGWEALCFAEIEAAPRAVLSYHYPDVPLRGDFTEIEGSEYGPVDLLVGGTPCQSFSVAGLRGGLADERGNLALEYLRLADRARPRWLVWENVPGVLSSDGGRCFGTFLGGLGELGYGFAYAVLDAQHFGVPQRRRRVFVVGHLGDWRRAAAVLFERQSLSGHPAPRREKRQRIANCLGASPSASSTPNVGNGQGDVIEVCSTVTSKWAKGSGGPAGDEHHNLVSEGRVFPTLDAASYARFGCNQWVDSAQFVMEPTCFTAKDHGADASDISPTLRAGGHSGSHANAGVMPAVAFTGGHHGSLDDGALSRPEDLSAGALRALREAASRGSPQERRLAGQPARELDAALSELSHEGASPEEALHHLRGTAEGARLLQQASAALQAMGRPHEGGNPAQDAMHGVRRDGSREGPLRSPLHAGQASAVRRLTPVECERLQGFPDDFTLVPYRGGMMKDGPRYKMLGNSMAVPVVRWIGERIAAVEALASQERAAA
jgi:DNA (cytosine-5)-methyltransferase 1